MPVKPISDTGKIKRIVRRFPWIPWTFLRIYVYPTLVRGQRSSFQAQAFFDDHYGQAAQLSDAATISPTYDPMHARLHYNAVEGSILRALVDRDPASIRTALDIGSGSGHWIDFLISVFDPERCVGTEFSTPSLEFLQEKYADDARIEILANDITKEPPTGEYDVISAIGVLFHIVGDGELLTALENLRSVLAPNGVILAGGHFGWLSRDIMFTRSETGILVTKRIRSLQWWRKRCANLDLRVSRVIRTKNPRGFLFPENNLLLIEHA